MSVRFFQMTESVAARTDLSPCAKLVHAALNSYEQMNGGAYPSQATIGKALGFSSRHVRNGLDELKVSGLVEAQRRGAFQSNLYKLTDKGKDCSARNDSSSSARNNSSYHSGTIVPPNRSEDSLNISGNDCEASTHAERLQWLCQTLANFNPTLGTPDTKILHRIESAAHGASEAAIEDALQRLYASGLQDRMRSWALLVKVLPEELEKGTL